MNIKYVYVIALFLFLFNCKAKEKIGRISDISNGIRVIFNFPMFNSVTGEVINTKDSFDLLYTKDTTVYRFFVKGKTEYIYTNKPSDTIYETLHEYFIFRNNKQGGQYYTYRDSVNKMAVDSVSKYRAMAGIKLYEPENDSLVVSIRDRAGKWTEVYVPRKKPDDSYNDTSYFSFSTKFHSTPFTLSRYLDSAKKCQLYKARLIYNPRKRIEGVMIPRRELYFEIKEMDEESKKTIEKYIKKITNASE